MFRAIAWLMLLFFAAAALAGSDGASDPDERFVLSYPLLEQLLVFDFDGDGDRDLVLSCAAIRVYSVGSVEDGAIRSSTTRLLGRLEDCLDITPEPDPPAVDCDGPVFGPAPVPPACVED